MKNVSQQRGFTLVELSIVLIIIGLIVGGVLAGQSLIASARLQAEISRFNQTDTAVGTFNLRFGGVPGDISATLTTSIPDANATPAARGGDSNGVIGTVGANYTNTEIAFAIQHLAAAGLVNLANFDTQANASNAVGIGILPARVSGGILLYGAGGRNFSRYGIADNTGAAAPGFTNNYTPEQVSQIDTRIDDGNATTGLVTSANSGGDFSTVGDTTAVTGCNSAAGVYTLTNATAACSFRVRLSS